MLGKPHGKLHRRRLRLDHVLDDAECVPAVGQLWIAHVREDDDGRLPRRGSAPQTSEELEIR